MGRIVSAMTHTQYKRCGYHWSVIEEAQRSPSRTATLAALLTELGAWRRLYQSNDAVIAALWRCYWRIAGNPAQLRRIVRSEEAALMHLRCIILKVKDEETLMNTQ